MFSHLASDTLSHRVTVMPRKKAHILDKASRLVKVQPLRAIGTALKCTAAQLSPQKVIKALSPQKRRRNEREAVEEDNKACLFH